MTSAAIAADKAVGAIDAIRIAFIDLDGTLLGPDKQVSEANRHALRKLQALGVETIIASGRDHRDIAALAAKTECSPWIVSSQGAMVKNAETGEVAYELTVDPQLAMNTHAWAHSRSLSTLAYTRHGVFVEHETEWTRLYASRYGRPHSGVISQLATSGLQKLLFSTEPTRIPQLEAELRQAFGQKLQIVRTEPETLEVLQLGAHKAQGAQAVANLFGFSQEEAAAFGDGNNDIELLGWAGYSVAMDHGWPDAKKAARFVSPHGPPGEAFARAVHLLMHCKA